MSDNLEARFKAIETKIEDLSLAVELFKAYGFQPKQYDELLSALKANRPQ